MERRIVFDFLFIAIGLALLTFGGDFLVRGSVSLAQRVGLPPFVIGLTLVGFGTSAPELFTSLQAALSGSPGIAIGNVVGSNIGNILLILGIAALLSPLSIDPAALKRDCSVLIVATVVTMAALLTGFVSGLAGFGLLSLLLIYVTATLVVERRRTKAAALYEAEADLVEAEDMGMSKSVVLAIAGLALTILGAKALVQGAVGVAQDFGVSETLIGLTIVAIGTSLPELVTSIIAVRKGHADVAFGNVVGSNIFNLLGILGVTAMVQPMTVPAEILQLDIWVMLAATVAMVVMATTGLRVSRREGVGLVASYGVYIGVLATLA